MPLRCRASWLYGQGYVDIVKEQPACSGSNCLRLKTNCSAFGAPDPLNPEVVLAGGRAQCQSGGLFAALNGETWTVTVGEDSVASEDDTLYLPRYLTLETSNLESDWIPAGDMIGWKRIFSSFNFSLKMSEWGNRGGMSCRARHAARQASHPQPSQPSTLCVAAAAAGAFPSESSRVKSNWLEMDLQR